MTVYLIRHGETITSGRTYAGRSDVPLTDHGRAQAHEIADKLSTQPVSFILTSPLSRAVETAAPLACRHGLTPVATAALMEIDFGDYEGRDKSTLGLNLRKTHAETPIPGGEALRDVWNRAGEVARLLVARREEAGAVVGHFWINRLLWGRMNGLSFDAACKSRDYRPRTGSCIAFTPSHIPVSPNCEEV
ncbi:histidine phosphatase family protein [Pseudaestuariivita atlantica]|uniref:histidine phosphatase family protein n=1 Tax=Pseudaestuariivita atlantica TaxID=1317121 RepID=UPI00067DB510|nr:histidine phosphatase family protein [Pseudaestuariivita atlantica]